MAAETTGRDGAGSGDAAPARSPTARAAQAGIAVAAKLLAVLLLGLGLLLPMGSQSLAGDACPEVLLTNDVLRSWYNPHPEPTDFELPMQLGMSLIFVPVRLGSQNLYGDAKSTFTMGAFEPRLFETHLEVRVGSSITGSDKERVLLMGKYELSMGQYSVVMGNGVLAKGIAVLAARTHDPETKDLLAPFLDPASPCQGKLTRAIARLLSEPLTFLTYRDYVEFLDTYNSFCVSQNRCRQVLSGLGRNRDLPGFVRLPLEHEWEFIARGGGEKAQGRLSSEQMQADLPPIESGKTLLAYAHIESKQMSAIGSLEPLFGFYDMLGNAQELMQNPFTAENGFGAVGAYVARGGDFRFKTDEMRVSRRIEWPAFRRDDTTNQIVLQSFPRTGLRLAVGLPVSGSEERIGASDLAADFERNYAPVDEAGDIAGNSLADAKDIGRLSAKAADLKDELSKDDGLDYYRFALTSYSALKLSVGKADRPIKIEVIDELQKAYASQTLGGTSGGQFTVSSLLPGSYFLKIAPAEQQVQAELNYVVSLVTQAIPDTGLERPSTDALPGAQRITTAPNVSFSGFVGAGDRTDTYAVADTTNRGGLRLKLTGFQAPLSLTFLDEKQQVVSSIESSGKQDALDLIINSSQGKKGFVQVAALGTSSSLYKLAVTAEQPYDPVFLVRAEPFTRSASESVTYSGYLDAALPTLILPITLAEDRNLRIELTGLTADADLQVLDGDRQAIASNHVRSGPAPEFFVKDVEAGSYYAAIRLGNGTERTPFTLSFSTTDPSVARVASPQVAKSKATNLVLMQSGNSYIENSKEPLKYYKFTVGYGSRFVTIDVNGFSADTDLDMFLEDNQGAVIAKSSNTGADPETIEQTLAAGDYFVRVQRSGSAAFSYYTLGIASMEEMTEPVLNLGRFVESQKDYKIYQSGDTCNMVAIASDVTPKLGWRTQLPAFVIGVERGSDTIWVRLDEAGTDDGSDLYRPGEIVGSVGGNRFPIRFESSWLKPIVPCGGKQKGMCMDSDAIRAFRHGSSVQIEGVSAKNGEAISFTYSLNGYTKAAQRINSLCGAKANWVWNK